MSIKQDNQSLNSSITEIEQYLSFIMDKEEYAIGILSVREIRGWEPVTPIPKTPKYVKGFINLRGTVVPIIDLRERFGLESVEYSDTTVVIILNAHDGNGQDSLVGIIVDAVSEVYDIKRSEIRNSPNLGSHIDTRFIMGIVEVNEKMVILTEVDTLLDTNDLFTNEAIATSIQ